MEIVKSLKESGLLIKGTGETVENKANQQKRGFLGILLSKLGASLSGNLLSGNGVIWAGEGTKIRGEKKN